MIPGVRVKATVRNYGSVWAARQGLIAETDIPQRDLDMLVDTGCIMSVLPQDEAEQLKLAPSRRVVVTYADERREERWAASGLEITIGDRSMVTDCVIGPPLSEPLLGQVVLEELDLVVNPARKTLGPRPELPNLPLLKLK